ncbi:MAG: peptide ABC transporter substrate-binding protein [Clostridia bacterium]|nr:peptide ABC transporter substrate-binding protein [Clostridia bacterium]
MKKVFALTLALCLLIACVPAMADGGTYTVFYSGEVSTLNYLVTATTWDQAMAANVVDTLVEYDNLGNVIPCLAETWENSEDGLTWTFHLRQGVKWYNCFGDEVAEVTANDFVAAMKYILTPEYDSAVAKQVFSSGVVNAEAYYNGEVTDFAEVGVKAEDDYTLVYTLADPVPYFLSATTYVTFMPAYGPQLEELGKDFGLDNQSLYFNGAYILETFEPQSEHLLVKNQNYWDAEHVYIEKINRLYNAESATLSPTAALRGEVDSASLDNDVLDDWLANHPELVTKTRSDLQYSYFYCFNFNPQYEEEYGPANWLIAVNNKNFRYSLMAAMDRVYSLTAEDAENPASLLENVITPPAFSAVDGVDFINLDAFANTTSYFYDESDPEGSAAKALAYKEAAVAELTAAGATFPVNVVLTYKTNDSNWAGQVQLIKDQMEGLLGTDYINVVLYAGPADSFLSATRRSGKYSIMRCNWGADYADPETWTDPFAAGNNYNFMDQMLETDNAETVADLNTYYAMVEEAKAEKADLNKRYNLFAAAEAYLIENAFILPYRTEMADYQVTKLDVFEGEYAPFGLCNQRYKFMHLHENFVTAEENAASFAAWQAALAE